MPALAAVPAVEAVPPDADVAVAAGSEVRDAVLDAELRATEEALVLLELVELELSDDAEAVAEELLAAAVRVVEVVVAAVWSSAPPPQPTTAKRSAAAPMPTVARAARCNAVGLAAGRRCLSPDACTVLPMAGSFLRGRLRAAASPEPCVTFP